MNPRLINLAEKFYNRPHLITPEKARFLLDVFAERHGFASLAVQEAAGADRRDPLAMQTASSGYVDGRSERRVYPVIDGGIAVIEAEGTLVNKNGLDPYSGMTGYDGMSVKLNAALDDASVRGILFNIDSHGGEVAGLFDLCAEIRAARAEKPVWAVATDVAFSAAMSLAGSCDKFFLPETGGAGSIGVVTMHIDWSKAIAEDGAVVTLIHAGAHKVDGNPFAPLPENVRADIQADVDAVWSIFADALEQAGRISAADAMATEAQCFMGRAAVAAGLADGVAPAKAVVAAFLDSLDGATAVALPAASAALLQPRKEAVMGQSKIPNSGRRNGRAEDAPKDNPEAMDDEEDATAAEETPAAEDDDEAPAAADDDEQEQDAAGDDTDPDAEDDDEPEVDTKTAKAIVGLPEAKASAQLAQTLAFAGVTVKTAKACLTAAAADRKQAGAGSLRSHMAGVDTPSLGPGDAVGSEPSGDAAVSGDIVANFNRARGIKPQRN